MSQHRSVSEKKKAFKSLSAKLKRFLGRDAKAILEVDKECDQMCEVYNEATYTDHKYHILVNFLFPSLIKYQQYDKAIHYLNNFAELADQTKFWSQNTKFQRNEFKGLYLNEELQAYIKEKSLSHLDEQSADSLTIDDITNPNCVTSLQRASGKNHSFMLC